MDFIAKKYLLTSTAICELFFVYSFVFSFFREHSTHLEHGWLYVLAWIIVGVKILLGYVLYKLYSSQHKQYKISGLVITLLIITVPFVLYYSNLETAYLVLGGPSFFILSANSIFLFMYWRHPDRYGLEGVHKDISPFVLILFIAVAVTQYGIGVLTVIYFWLIVNAINFKVISVKKKTS